MEGLFNARIKAEEERNKRIRDQFGQSKAFGYGMMAGQGLRGLAGKQTKQEQLAALQDDALKSVTAPQGTPEYFTQLAQQLADRGLRQSAMQAMAKAQEVARSKVTDDTNKLALEKAQADQAAKKRVAELSKQVKTPISTNPYKHYLELAELVRNDGLYSEVKGIVEMAKDARSSSGKDKGLAGYLGFTSDQGLKRFTDESVAQASRLFLGGQATPADVMAVLQIKDNVNMDGMSLKEFQESFKGHTDSLADPQAAMKLYGQYATQEITWGEFLTQYGELPVKSEYGEGLTKDVAAEWDTKTASASAELKNAQQLLANADAAITGSAQPVREFLATGVATIYESLGGTPPEWINASTVATGQMKAALGRFILARIKTLGTNPSNADLKFLQGVLPNLGNSKEAIKKMSEYLVKRAQGTIELGTKMKEWSQKAEEAGFRGEIMQQRPDLLSAQEAASPEAIEEFFASLEDTEGLPPVDQMSIEEIKKELGVE